MLLTIFRWNLNRPFIVDSSWAVILVEMAEVKDTHAEENRKAPDGWRYWRPPRRQPRWRVLWAAGMVGSLMVIGVLVLQLYPGTWQHVSEHPLGILRGRVPIFIGMGLALAVFIVLLAIGGALLEWTGFSDKKLWDWLQLLSALAIPVVLAVAGFWFTAQQDTRQQQLENQRAEAERELAAERAQDEALQTYLGQMGTLLLKEDLRSAEEGSEVLTLARARTLTVLSRLRPDSKRTVIEFLYEASLINGANPVLELDDADLSEIDLSSRYLKQGIITGDPDLEGINLQGADMSNADLRSANLSNANLHETNMSGADLRGAFLEDADLFRANLRDADMSGATNKSGLDERYAVKVSNEVYSVLNLRGADLWQADLSGADLSGANLSDSKELLSFADLSGVDLSNANLRSVGLPPRGLPDADLSGANLRGADTFFVSSKQLAQQAKSLEGATMPNGQKYEDWLKDREGREEGGDNE